MSNIQRHKNTLSRLEKKTTPPKRYAHVIEYDSENDEYIIPDGKEPNSSGVLCVPKMMSETDWESYIA